MKGTWLVENILKSSSTLDIYPVIKVKILFKKKQKFFKFKKKSYDRFSRFNHTDIICMCVCVCVCVCVYVCMYEYVCVNVCV